jgi:hypothetical protein
MESANDAQCSVAKGVSRLEAANRVANLFHLLWIPAGVVWQNKMALDVSLHPLVLLNLSDQFTRA